MGGVFISYRRDGSSSAARTVSEQLRIRLGARNVFIDVSDITPGYDWYDTLVAAVAECEILLAIIGVNWVACATPSGVRRIDDESDYVRVEIETALKRNIPVIPVLVERALLPRSDCLPDTLKKLPFRQGSTITPENFDSDTKVLVSNVERILCKRREDAIWETKAENQKKLEATVTSSAVSLMLDSIIQEFDPVELDSIVLLNFGQEIYDECVDDGSVRRCSIRKLTQRLIVNRVLFQFLNAIRTARPTSDAISRALEPFSSIRHCPDENQVISDVRAGLMVLNELRDDPYSPVTATNSIDRSEVHPTKLASELDKLRAYKVLHDTLHKIQMTIYLQLRKLIVMLHVEDRAAIADQIRTHTDSLTILVQEAISAATGLRNTRARFDPEMKWINSLSSIILTLESALQDEEIAGFERARRAVRDLRTLIRTNPPRVNQELREAAQTLPLRDLVSLFRQIGSISELSIRQKYVLDAARASLEFLNISLQGRVALHTHWQDLETELWGADDQFEQDRQTASDELEAAWYNVRQKIEPLWSLDPNQQWVLSTKQYATAFEGSQSAPERSIGKARYNHYDRFRFHARCQFFSVDSALRDFCGRVLVDGALRDFCGQMLKVGESAY